MNLAHRTDALHRHSLPVWYLRRNRAGLAFISGHSIVLRVRCAGSEWALRIPDRQHWLSRADWRAVLAREIRALRARWRARELALAAEMDEA